MLTTVLFMLLSAIFIPIFYVEWRSHQEKKVLEEIHQYCLLYNMDALEQVLKSKRAKYLSDYVRFTYSEHLRIVRNYYKEMEKYNNGMKEYNETRS